MDIKARILEGLSKGHLMSLATLDDGGLWVADVIYIYDDNLNIYWMSYPNVRHSKAIEKNGQVAGSITVTCYGEKPELGIQFSGKAEKINELKHDVVARFCAKNGDPEPEEGEDVLGGHSWYILRPSKIDLNDTENFGWDKKNIEL